MGATGWQCRTFDYDPDPEIALQQLRDDAFARGDYLAPGGILRIPTDVGFPPQAPLRFHIFLSLARGISALLIFIHWLARGCRQPRSIDELRALTGANGTHSILDIDHIADIPELCAATPLSKHRLLKNFGTTTPSEAQAEAALAGDFCALLEEIRRWEAIYFVAHGDDGLPRYYVFMGVSGD